LKPHIRAYAAVEKIHFDGAQFSPRHWGQAFNAKVAKPRSGHRISQLRSAGFESEKILVAERRWNNRSFSSVPSGRILFLRGSQPQCGWLISIVCGTKKQREKSSLTARNSLSPRR